MKTMCENWETMTKAEKIEELEKMTAGEKMSAVKIIIGEPNVNWFALVNGCKYNVYTYDEDNDDIKLETAVIKATDCFILKPNSKSHKRVVAGELYTMLESFGCNLSDAYLSAVADDGTMHRYAQYKPSLDCFICETCTSGNMLEKQLQAITDYMALL